MGVDTPALLDFRRDGCIRADAAVPTDALIEMRIMSIDFSAVGTRLTLASPLALQAVDCLSPFALKLAAGARPVRAVFFDKTS